MMKKNNIFAVKSNTAQKGLMSGVIVFIIVVISTLAVINVLNPFVEQGKGYQDFNEARQAIRSIGSTVSQIAIEAPGSQRSISLDLHDGRLIVSDADDTIKIRLNDVKDIVGSGFETKEGNVVIRGGAFMRAYEADIDNDSTTDFVMENSAVLFAVKKIGSSSQPASINTTNFITQMQNKRLNVNITPATGIFINDDFNTSYGTGYTDMSPIGNNIESAAIKVAVNSTAGIMYEAQFILSAAQDFVDMRIKRVERI